MIATSPSREIRHPHCYLCLSHAPSYAFHLPLTGFRFWSGSNHVSVTSVNYFSLLWSRLYCYNCQPFSLPYSLLLLIPRDFRNAKSVQRMLLYA